MKILVAALLLLAGCAGDLPPASAPQIRVRTLSVAAGPGRLVDLIVRRPAKVRGVAIFGHGQGYDASHYPDLLAALTRAGWLVVAPIHVDALIHPRRAAFDQRSGFAARVADIAAATEAAETLAPGKPIVAVGHSYGALLAAMQGGALSAMIPARAARVRAVLEFSSPGRIPNLITPQSYATLSVPTMVVTGDADIVPGFIPEWRQHLASFEDSPPGDKYALIVAGGTHALAVDGTSPAYDRATAAALDFLAAYGLGDRRAKARLAALGSATGIEVRRR